MTLKFEYLSEILTLILIKNSLTHWSVAQAGSNDEKNWRSKISLDSPFKSPRYTGEHRMHFSLELLTAGLKNYLRVKLELLKLKPLNFIN